MMMDDLNLLTTDFTDLLTHISWQSPTGSARSCTCRPWCRTGNGCGSGSRLGPQGACSAWFPPAYWEGCPPHLCHCKPGANRSRVEATWQTHKQATSDWAGSRASNVSKLLKLPSDALDALEWFSNLHLVVTFIWNDGWKWAFWNWKNWLFLMCFTALHLSTVKWRGTFISSLQRQ